MPQRTLKGRNQKIVYRNERYTKGTVTTDDPLYEGSFRRLINFQISNQNSSLQNREPFITVPLYNLNNEEIKLSSNSHVFSFKEDTEHAFIFDIQQEINTNIINVELEPLFEIEYNSTLNKFNKIIKTLEEDGSITETEEEINFYVVDGDTINIDGKRYRLAIIDAPELEDITYSPANPYNENTQIGYRTRGEESKVWLENKIKSLNGRFRISQFDFQSDKTDQFGRPVVFIIHEEELINFSLFQFGYAGIYGLEKLSVDPNDNQIDFFVPDKVTFKDGYIFSFNYWLSRAYDEARNNQFSPINKQYLNYKINFNPVIHPIYKTKPVVHKIEKNTGLEKIKIDDPFRNIIEELIIKRVIKTFEVNELKVKEDLEVFTEESLEYKLITNKYNKADFSLTNSKYEDEYLNFFTSVYNTLGMHLYTGLAELKRTSPNPEEGIFETFSLRTYKRPEVHIEIQDQTNYKPNMLSDASIIPIMFDHDTKQANARGITSPSVDTVLLRTIVNKDLQEDKGDTEPTFIKYFKTGSLVYNKFKRNSQIEAIFKTPEIKSNNSIGKKRYMYRWDLISGKEIDVGNKEEIENFNPYFRSAWIDLESNANISTNPERVRSSAIGIESARSATKYLIIERKIDALENHEDYFVNDDLGMSKTDQHDESTYLYNLNNDIEDFIESKTLDQLKNLFTQGSGEALINIEGKDYIVRDVFEHNAIASSLSERNYNDDIGITINSISKTSLQTYQEVKSTFEEVEKMKGKLSFIFLPYRVAVTDKDDNEKTLFISSKTQTITFDLELDRKVFLPPLINVKEDIFENEELVNIISKETIIDINQRISIVRKEERILNPLLNISESLLGKVGIDVTIPAPKIKSIKKEKEKEEEVFKITIDDFFQDGFVAVFYLATYDEVSDLKYDDTFYDQTAYKKTSAVYTFKDYGALEYKPEDFIRDRLQNESYALRYCKYIGKFDDMTVIYGNPRYRNTIFLSEPGSPYYYGLVNAFEFDNEVVHVNQFKEVLMVFTINDIYVLYWHEEKVQMQDEEGKYFEQSKWSIRQKKILYNISTQHKNKNSIKNLTRYVTLVSNNVLYLITPSAYIDDNTQFSLKILSQNIQHLMEDPLYYINERLNYFGINEKAEEYKFNLNASDNFIKLYYSVEVESKPYALIVTYDVLNNRWYEEDTISFGNPEQIYLLDATTGHEMLTNQNNQLFLTYQTDKFKNLLLDEYGQSFYDLGPIGEKEHSIKYFIDTGYLKVTEHLRKRFRQLLINIKNIDSKELGFTYDFTIDDIQHVSDFSLEYTTNFNNEIIEILKLENKQILSSKQSVEELMDALGINKIVKEEILNNTGHLDNFILDFSNLSSSDIMMVRHNLIGRGRIPRIKMGFTATNRFYILSFGIVYTEKGGR